MRRGERFRYEEQDIEGTERRREKRAAGGQTNEEAEGWGGVGESLSFLFLISLRAEGLRGVFRGRENR